MWMGVIPDFNTLGCCSYQAGMKMQHTIILVAGSPGLVPTVYPQVQWGTRIHGF